MLGRIIGGWCVDTCPSATFIGFDFDLLTCLRVYWRSCSCKQAMNICWIRQGALFFLTAAIQVSWLKTGHCFQLWFLLCWGLKSTAEVSTGLLALPEAAAGSCKENPLFCSWQRCAPGGCVAALLPPCPLKGHRPLLPRLVGSDQPLWKALI